MSKANQTVVVRGRTMYAKVLGDPVPNYAKDGKEWTLDLIVDKSAIAVLKSAGISNKVKRREDRYNNEPYVTFKQKELNSRGEPNKPIRVVDIKGKPWDPEALIGNESVVDVRVNVRDWGKGMNKGVYPNAIRVLKHVPYTSTGGFDPLDEDDEFFDDVDNEEGNTTSSYNNDDDDDDDDIPF